MATDRDTIAAVATAPGAGGVGIVRVSGPAARAIGVAVCGRALRPRHAHFARFRDADGEVIDEGVALLFAGPASYTGEDVLELQGHGGAIVLQALLRRCLALGARPARAGEFTERAFLEGKLDLAQAEAVADLVAAGSLAAVRAARRSLEGEFSRQVEDLLGQLLDLRMYIEAALDFPDEQIDFLAAPELQRRRDRAQCTLEALLAGARRGARLRDGLHVLILGAPNVGKSSLLNALVADERAIVSDIAGTTRDLLREHIELDGIALTLVDSAGLRSAPDAIEAEGIRRARAELARADLVLAVGDAAHPPGLDAESRALLPAGARVLHVHAKCDREDEPARVERREDGEHLWLSARTGAGMDGLRERLRAAAGAGEGAEGGFSARARHVEALERTQAHLHAAGANLAAGQAELAAEDLRRGQHSLGEITGAVEADELLGRIFAGFCIGK